MDKKTMRAIAVVEEGKLEVVELPVPEYGDYECLVRITACGYCSGTDRKIVHNKLADMPIKYPTIIGHESVGHVVACGSKVRNFKVGDRVTSPLGKTPPPPYSSTFGMAVEYGVIQDIEAMNEDNVSAPGQAQAKIDPIDYLVKEIPDFIDDVDAVMLLTFKENFSALKNFGMKEGMDVLIYGDGAVANGVALFAKLLGAGWVGCVGHHDDRLEKIVGVAKPDLTVNSHKVDVAQAMGDRKVDLVIDCVGSVDVIKEGAKFLVPGGRVSVYGVLSKATANINLTELPNNISIHMLNWPYREHREHDAIIQLIEEGKLDPKDFYSHVLPAEECQKGAEMIENREAYKVIFTF